MLECFYLPVPSLPCHVPVHAERSAGQLSLPSRYQTALHLHVQVCSAASIPYARSLAMTIPRRALLVIDVQNEYVTGDLPIEFPDVQTSLANIARAMDAARDAGIPIVVVQN